MSSLIPLEQARQIVLSAVAPGPVVQVPLRAAAGRTLAQAVVCDIDYPPFDRATMDGYAVRSVDLGSAPAELTVIGQIAAGTQPDQPLAAGQAVQINTGAPIPQGCDAVVRVEDTEVHDQTVTIRGPAQAGQFITRKGTCVQAGQTVLEAGKRLSAGQIAIAAASGVTTLAVYQQPSLGILVTGDELVGPGCTPVGGQIRDSNRYLLDALARQTHCRPVDLGVARDDRRLLIERIGEGLKLNFLCITGGVSMGQADYVPGCLEDCGATIRFHRVAVKPGRPTLFATTDAGAYVFGLPGNPVSAFVAFWLFVAPALARWQGGSGDVPLALTASLTAQVGLNDDRRRLLPATVQAGEDGGLTVGPLPGQGSGDPFALARANALVDTAPHARPQQAGERVGVFLLELP